MSFMQPEITAKGALYSCDCAKCGATMYAHEWASNDPNSDRDAMKDGTLRCAECGGRADPETFTECGRQYAGRYSAPGYLDCTDWNFDTSKRRLLKTLRDLYA